MYRYTLFLLIPLLLPFAADAQVLNVERFRSDADTADVWIGELKFDFSLSKQNTTVMALGNETNLAHFTRNHVYYFLNQINLVSVSTGLMIENEFWRESDEPSVEKTLLKSTTSLLIRGRLTEQAEMVMIGYYQAPPASFFKPRITGDAKLNLKISSNLTFTTQFVLTYDADPLIDVTKVVYRLTNGIVISI
ncbi:MAG: hypothetical protein LC662_00190 [Rhodothermaceae bacterium]|nr:hypothetical protein [Rhodothermaceae bacterium]